MLEPTTSIAIGEAQLGRRQVSAEKLAEHEGLVRWVVGQQRLRGLPFEDAVHAGRIGLWHALQGYDPSRGTRFSTYAVVAIKRAVWRAVAEDQPLVPIPSPRQPSDLAELPDLSQEISRVEVAAELHQLVAKLPPRLCQVIVAHYGLTALGRCADYAAPDNLPQSFAAIGQALGVTRQRAQQLHVEALLWLAQPAHSLALRRLLERHQRRDYQQFASRQRKLARTRRGYRRTHRRRLGK